MNADKRRLKQSGTSGTVSYGSRSQTVRWRRLTGFLTSYHSGLSPKLPEVAPEKVGR
jgi:hypothetical protein